MVTQADWATTVLNDAGCPASSTNIDNMKRWMANEEPPTHWWNTNNPLNVGHTTSVTSAPFKTLSTSAAATAFYLRMPDYQAIFAALAASSSAAVFSAAVVASPWAASHYGGTPTKIAQTPIPATVDAGAVTLVVDVRTPGTTSALGKSLGVKTFAPKPKGHGTGLTGLDVLLSPGAGGELMVRTVEVILGGLLLALAAIAFVYALVGKAPHPAKLVGKVGKVAAVGALA